MMENRKGCVLGQRRCEPNGLAQIAHCVTRHGKHEFGDLCKMVGSRSDALARRTDGLSEDLTLRQTIALSNLQDDRRIVEEVCRRVGGVFVPLPDATSTDEDVYEALAEAVAELGQDSSIVRRIVSDRVVTADEASQADREISETIAALVRLREVIHRKVSAPAPSLGRMVALRAEVVR